MYVTRSLSFYRGFPEAIEEPPRGPGSGYLVIGDQEEEAPSRNWIKPAVKHHYLRHLPLPQDRRLTTEFVADKGITGVPVLSPLYFIPVIDQPLSSNRYYAIIGEGKYQGLISTCSTKANRGKCVFIKYVRDEKPRPFRRENICQQVEIVPNKGISRGTFHAKSTAPDMYPANYLRVQAWGVYPTKKHINPLSRVDGVDDALRASTPNTKFSSGTSSSPHVVVGRWYCPYIFVREDEMSFGDQVEKTMFYKMTMEQFWEEIYGCKNHRGSGDAVSVRTSIDVKRVSLCLHGEEVVEGEDIDGVTWFRSTRQGGGGVGLDAVILERMKWEEERVGWVEGKKKVERVEEFDGRLMAGWKKFRCFVLVERFALKRMDGSLILTHDFLHADKILCRWE